MTTRQQIEKLKKQILLEELRRRGKKPRHRRLLLTGAALLMVLMAGFFWYRANLDDILEKRFQKGLALRDAGDAAGAAELLRDLQTKHPDAARAPEALLQAAKLLNFSLNRFPEALLAYLSLERDYAATPQAAEARQQIAGLYKYRLNDQPRAIIAYQRLIDNDGEDTDQLQYEVADCYFRLNNFEQARIEFENLLRNYPGSALAPEVQFRVAVTHALEGDAENAMVAYREVSARWPQSPYAIEARFGLATVLEERDRLQEALSILEGLQGAYPNREALAQRIANLQGRLGKKLTGR
ncbi:MAG: tetratricopeptide repeat protein [Desulfuromonas sp.]|nr:tetratricopeptide repeat protein [Desulfuromonas sp.]